MLKHYMLALLPLFQHWVLVPTIFCFEVESDLEKVFVGEPWSYDRHLVVFQRYDGKTPMKELDFAKCLFWVQIHNLPFNLLSLEIALDVGETLGEVVRMEDTSEMVGGNFLRVRVAIDILQPLCRGRKITYDGRSEGWVSFNIRAVQFNSSQKSVVEVKGFEVDTSKRSSQFQLTNNLFNSVQVQFGPLQKPVIMTKEARKDCNLPSSELVIENQLEVGKNDGQLNMDLATVDANSKTECGGSWDKADGAKTSGEKQMVKDLDNMQAWHVSNSSLGGAMELVFNVDSASQKQEKRILNSGDGYGWSHLTGFYGNPDTSRRTESWNLLKYLSGLSQFPWLVIGDFNEIVGLSEKEGGADRPTQQMQNFIDTLNCYGLHDLGFTGPKFTWLYQKVDGSQIRERLDRVVATVEWTIKFPQAKLFHKSSSSSDHNPLVLQLVKEKIIPKHPKIFWFEAMWLKDSSCEEVVTSAWDEGLFMGS
uniref:DUF4283 domain-containing protein n=1 Tax=Quercus lobata TaxID=97700 RepID=A0A7N2L446_QUELO